MPQEPLTMLNATKVCVVPVWKRPDMAAACLAAITRAKDYRSWAFVFSLDRGVDPANMIPLDAFPGTKQVLRQPNHPYPGPTYNILAAMKSATKLPCVEQILYLPEDYLVDPAFFTWHTTSWRAVNEVAAQVAAGADGVKPINVPQVCGVVASERVAGRSWPVAAIKKIVALYPESYFLFGNVFVKKTWPTFKYKPLTFDGLVDEVVGRAGAVPSRSLATHVGFYTEPSSPAGLRWARETDAMSLGKKVERILAMTADERNERRDQHVAPMTDLESSKRVPNAPPAPQA